jgi:hypothetical protein
LNCLDIPPPHQTVASRLLTTPQMHHTARSSEDQTRFTPGAASSAHSLLKGERRESSAFAKASSSTSSCPVGSGRCQLETFPNGSARTQLYSLASGNALILRLRTLESKKAHAHRRSQKAPLSGMQATAPPVQISSAMWWNVSNLYIPSPPLAGYTDFSLMGGALTVS